MRFLAKYNIYVYTQPRTFITDSLTNLITGNDDPKPTTAAINNLFPRPEARPWYRVALIT